MNGPTALVLALAVLGTVPPLPPTPKKPVVDEYHGVKVVDDYRWLEDWSDPKVKQWSEAENAHARAVLDALPHRAQIDQRLTQLLSWESPAYSNLQSKGGRIFALKNQPPKQQPFIVLVGSLEKGADEQVLVDPNAIDPSGSTSIDFYVPSLDGRYVAVSLSKGGTESGDVHIFEVATKKELTGDVIPRANSGTAGGSVTWNKDSTGLWYTRHPAPGERPDSEMGFWQQVWFHKLGTRVAKDTYAIGKDFPRIAETELHTSDDGKYVSAIVQLGDGGEYQLFLLDVAKNAWTKVASYADEIKATQFGLEGGLWALSRKGADRGTLLRIPLATPTLEKAQRVVPQSEATISHFEITPSRVYVVEQVGGPSRLQVFNLKGKDLGTVPTLPVSTVSGVKRLTGDDVVFANTSYVEPLAWYRYDAKSGKVARTALAQTSPADFSDVEVVRETCTSKDGTKVPVSIIKPKKLKLDGNNPTLLYGYGGFNIPMTPGFSKALKAWLEQGGVYAVANIRGGSEFGEQWHEQGSKTKKQNVFDDFIGCAKHLIARKYTHPKKLAIEGGSNGGLLMGAALTQAPELFGAVVAHVGYFDMLRFETKPNGAFNNTEYGSVQSPEEFKALYAYSPYHHVKKGVTYPPSLFMTGANDPRVDPLHSRKMVAALQSVGADALLRTSGSTGHGMGTPLKEKIAETVDAYAFLFKNLGVTYRPVKAAKK